ncbi:MAG: sigma 54-interacting transcriptional regulator [Pseudomonadota bacterium]
MSAFQTRNVGWNSAPLGFENGAQLRVLGSSQVMNIQPPSCSIGSALGNDVVLADPYVSKRHCSIRWQGGGIWIKDEKSRNGTWVGNMRVDSCSLLQGARIVVGKTSLELVGPPLDGGRWGLIGNHPSMLKVFQQIERFGESTNSVLILGESGTGKELVARALHAVSPCNAGPFEVLNCGAIPKSLAESQLFGHEKGAFTGATQLHRGAFERADGGSLFLDELGEMPLELQPKLLRALEEGLIQRVGGEKRNRVTVRVIAATHRNPAADIKQGKFRMDLYHRLAVGVIRLPALRERKEDIPLLIDYFVGQNQCQSSFYSLEKGVIPFLKEHSWPGNVRELKNIVQQAKMVGGPVLAVRDFGSLWAGSYCNESDETVRFKGRTFFEIRKEIYSRVLEEHEGNRSSAANSLGIPKSTFYDHLRGLGICEPTAQEWAGDSSRGSED